jgi:hypothetical protein
MRLGRRAGASLGLLIAGLATLGLWSGKSGIVIAALSACGALMAWVSALTIDALRAGRAGQPSERRRRARSCKRKTRVVAPGERDDPRIQPGDYFSCGRSLYRVEHLCGDRVLIEDCVSGALIDIDREACAALERIKRSG